MSLDLEMMQEEANLFLEIKDLLFSAEYKMESRMLEGRIGDIELDFSCEQDFYKAMRQAVSIIDTMIGNTIPSWSAIGLTGKSEPSAGGHS